MKYRLIRINNYSYVRNIYIYIIQERKVVRIMVSAKLSNECSGTFKKSEIFASSESIRDFVNEFIINKQEIFSK